MKIVVSKQFFSEYTGQPFTFTEDRPIYRDSFTQFGRPFLPISKTFGHLTTIFLSYERLKSMNFEQVWKNIVDQLQNQHHEKLNAKICKKLAQNGDAKMLNSNQSWQSIVRKRVDFAKTQVQDDWNIFYFIFSFQ